jgi:hypothetical protein
MRLSITRKLIAGMAAMFVMAAGLSAPAFAVSPSGGVVGNWAVVDHGQGCWGGGNLRADGTAGGNGNCSFSTPVGHEVASLDPVSWNYTDNTDTQVELCANMTGKIGTYLPVGVPQLTCVVVPVNTNTPVDLGQGTFAKVTIH